MKFGGKVFKGKALLETNELIFRGEHPLTIPFNKIKSVDATDGELNVVFHGGTASFIIDKKAESWQEKILHPRSVLDKLGIKEDSRVSVDGVLDKDFLDQLKAKAEHVTVKGLQKESDFIFYAADSKRDLSKLKNLKQYLKNNGALWIVSLKGKQAHQRRPRQRMANQYGVIPRRIQTPVHGVMQRGKRQSTSALQRQWPSTKSPS